MVSGPGSGRSPWRRAWQHTPVFLPGEYPGQRSLVGYSPQGHKELDTTECTQLVAELDLAPESLISWPWAFPIQCLNIPFELLDLLFRKF